VSEDLVEHIARVINPMAFVMGADPQQRVYAIQMAKRAIEAMRTFGEGVALRYGEEIDQ